MIFPLTDGAEPDIETYVNLLTSLVTSEFLYPLDWSEFIFNTGTISVTSSVTR